MKLILGGPAVKDWGSAQLKGRQYVYDWTFFILMHQLTLRNS